MRHTGEMYRPSLILFLALLHAVAAPAQTGSISGTIADTNGGTVRGAEIRLAPDRVMQSAPDGSFSFPTVAPGPFQLTLTATGFAPKTITGELHAGENLTLPTTALTIAVMTSDVNVTATVAEIAQAQVKVEEKQRVLGIIPNFLAVYEPDPAPLSVRQKFDLTSKTFLDPFSFAVNGIAAAVDQAQNKHKGFGQGAQGYGKRYGAVTAEFITASLLEHAVMPSLIRQDPRYIYKGTGTVGERAWYAISHSVICRGDNKKDQICYSRLISTIAAAEITNEFYPADSRYGQSLIFRDAAFGIAGHAAANLVREFIAPKLMHKKP
jgi:hypothetical protein